jgi:hypothetical protein
MTRRCFVLGIALMWGSLLATVAGGQSSSETKSLAERMAAMRRRPAPTTPGTNEAKANPRRRPSGGQQTEGRSLLPNWFSRDEQQQGEAAEYPNTEVGAHAASEQ